MAVDAEVLAVSSMTTLPHPIRSNQNHGSIWYWLPGCDHLVNVQDLCQGLVLNTLCSRFWKKIVYSVIAGLYSVIAGVYVLVLCIRHIEFSKW